MVRDRGIRLLRKLVREIQLVWAATAETPVALQPGGLEVDVEYFAITVEPATVSIRTLDLEVFANTVGTAYTSARDSSPEGGTVRGLTVIRNAHVHAPTVIDPDIANVQGPFGLRGPWRVYPRWQPYDSLPHEIRHPADQRNEPAMTVITTYRREVEGQLVVETLLNALRFFVVCDPSLARWTSPSVLEGFPLPPLPNHGQYERHDPFEMTVRDQDQALRDYASTQTPASSRFVTGYMVDNDELVYFGYSTAYGLQTFVERARQVRRDIVGGAEYWVEAEMVALQGDTLVVGSTGELVETSLAESSHEQVAEARWRLGLCDSDVYFYIRDRKA